MCIILLGTKGNELEQVEQHLSQHLREGKEHVGRTRSKYMKQTDTHRTE